MSWDYFSLNIIKSSRVRGTKYRCLIRRIGCSVAGGRPSSRTCPSSRTPRSRAWKACMMWVLTISFFSKVVLNLKLTDLCFLKYPFVEMFYRLVNLRDSDDQTNAPILPLHSDQYNETHQVLAFCFWIFNKYQTENICLSFFFKFLNKFNILITRASNDFESKNWCFFSICIFKFDFYFRFNMIVFKFNWKWYFLWGRCFF
jgi:hypothetical protein